MICLLPITKTDYLSLYCTWGIQLLIKNMCDFFSGPTIGHYRGFTCEAFQGKLCTVWQSLRGAAVQVAGPSSWPHSHIFAFLPQVPSFLGPFIWFLLQTLTLRPPLGGRGGEPWRHSPHWVPSTFPLLVPSLYPPPTAGIQSSSSSETTLVPESLLTHLMGEQSWHFLWF